MKFADPTLIPDPGEGYRPLLAHVPDAPELHRAPRWLVRRTRGAFPDLRGEPVNGYGLVVAAASECGDAGWIDHAGALREDGAELFVSEPYGLHIERAAALLAFADRVGARVTITASSSWYPTRTLRIVLRPDEGDEGR